MKKLVTALLSAGIGYALWLKVAADNQNRVVWEQVTDPDPID